MQYSHISQMHRPKTFDPPRIDFFTSPCPYYVNQYTKFTLFPGLPRELQLLIWSFTQSKAQTIGVLTKCKRERDAADQLACSRNDSSCFHLIAYKPPILLHVCHDSRMVALKSYCLAFQEQFARPIYMNFEKDGLLLTSIYAARCFYASTPSLGLSAHNMDSLRSLTLYAHQDISVADFQALCKNFTGLEVLCCLCPFTARYPAIKCQYLTGVNPGNRKFWDKSRPFITMPTNSRGTLRNWKPPVLLVGTREQFMREREARMPGEPMDWSYTVVLPSLKFTPVFGNVDTGRNRARG